MTPSPAAETAQIPPIDMAPSPAKNATKDSSANNAQRGGWYQLDGVPEIREMIFKEHLRDMRLELELQIAQNRENSEIWGRLTDSATADCRALKPHLNVLQVCKDFKYEALPIFAKHLGLVENWESKWEGTVAQLSHQMQLLGSIGSHYGLNIRQVEVWAVMREHVCYEAPGFLRALNRVLLKAGLEGSDVDRRFKKWFLTFRGPEDKYVGDFLAEEKTAFDYSHECTVNDALLKSTIYYYGNGRAWDVMHIGLEGNLHELDWEGFDWEPTVPGDYEP